MSNLANLSSSSPPVKLSTFSYTPLDPAAQSDLEEGREEARSDDRPLTEADDEGVEAELIWNRQLEHSERRRRRLWWIRQIALFSIGAVVGATLLSIGNRAFDNTATDLTAQSRTTSAAPSSPSSTGTSHTGLGSDFDFAANPPVRIHFKEQPRLNDRPPLLPPSKCPVPVVYTSDQSSADLVVFNADSAEGLEEDEMRAWKDEKPWQKLVISGVESAPNRDRLEKHFDKLRQGRRNETYHYEMTYRLNSTVPTTYSYSYFNYDNPPIPYAEKRQNKIAASFISNCRPKNARTLILDELTKLLPDKFDNFGRCHNNANADETLREMGKWEDVGTHNNWNTKITMINYYLFSVAFENSNDYDYVTEKYFQALERGSVPLVFGAPSYRSRFFPSPNAAIDIADYLPLNCTVPSRSDDKEPEELSDEARAGLRKLADRLTHLSSDEGKEEYESMLSWKLTNDWKTDPENPLGKIVKISTSQWDQDCQLARIFREGSQHKNNIPR